jgi:hypothetical protein
MFSFHFSLFCFVFRVHIIDHKSGYQCDGCILSEETHQQKIYHIAIDEPINISPNQQEIILAQEYKLLPNFFILLNLKKSQHHLTIRSLVPQSAHQSNPHSYFMCRCQDVLPKRSMFTCSHCGNPQCWKHFLPWNDQTNSPNLVEISAFAEYLLTHFPEASCISTRALLYFQKWKNARTEIEQHSVALECLQEDGINCTFCGVDSPVAIIEKLLFPPSESSSISATPKSRLVLLPEETIHLRLIDREKYRFEELQQNGLLSTSLSDDQSYPLNSMGSANAEPSSVVFSEIDVTIQRDWDYDIFRAALLSSLFEDMMISSSESLDISSIPPKYFQEGEWDDYSIYLIESDFTERGEDDLVVGGWKWVTHTIINNSKINSNDLPMVTGRDKDKGYLLVNQLHDDDTLTIRSNRDNVGPPCRISVLGAEYSGNKDLQYKTKELNLYYSGWRKIRGDGNCYFRAVIFGYIENIISNTFEGMTSCISIDENSFEKKQLAMKTRQDSFGHLLQILHEVNAIYRYDHEIDAHQRLIWAVSRARGKCCCHLLPFLAFFELTLHFFIRWREMDLINRI